MTQAQINALTTALTAILGGHVAKQNAKSAKGLKAKVKMTDAEKQASVEAAFKKRKFPAGTAAPVANVNVLTYGKAVGKDGEPTGWLAKGRRVNKGEKAMYLGNMPVFHECQTHVMDDAELRALAEEIVRIKAKLAAK